MQISFECSKCGKCCNSTPSLTLSEIFKFQNDFIIFFTLKPEMVYYRGIVSRQKFINLGKKDLILFADFDDGSGIIVEGSFQAYNYKTEKCFMLDSNGLCKLHLENRIPLACSTVPIQPMCVDFEDYQKNFPKSIKKIRVYKRCVRFDPNNKRNLDIIWENGKFNDQSPLVISMNEEINEMKKDREKIIKYFYNTLAMGAYSDMGLDIQSLDSMLSQNPDIKMTLSPVFLFELQEVFEKFSQTLKNDYNIDYSHILEFYKIQANLIEKYFEENKIDKEYENTLTAILETYKNILDEK